MPSAQYHAIWHATWNNFGKRSDNDSIYEGDPFVDNVGKNYSKIGFDWQQIQADTANRDIVSIKLKMDNRHTYWFAGMTSHIGYHNNSSEPSGSSSTSGNFSVAQYHWDYQQEKTVTLPKHIGERLRDGTAKGITLGRPNAGNRDTYGYFSNSNAVTHNKPRLTIEWEDPDENLSDTESLRLLDTGASLPGGLWKPLAGRAWTPHDSLVDITDEDIDLRIDLTKQSWTGHDTGIRYFVAKYDTNNDRAYAIRFHSNGDLALAIADADGGGSSFEVITATSKPSTRVSNGGRITLRVTLNVSNNNINFYTGPSVEGPWTNLGSEINRSGSFTVNSSSSVLELGTRNDGAVDRGWDGIIHAFQLRRGINGTRVVDVDFSKQTPGTDQFSDDVNQTWNVESPATIVPAAVAVDLPLTDTETISVSDDNWSLPGDQSPTDTDTIVVVDADQDAILDIGFAVVFNGSQKNPGFVVTLGGVLEAQQNFDTMDVFRRDITGRYPDRRVRGLASVTPTQNNITVVDYEAPLNTHLQYFLRLFDGAEVVDIGPVVPTPQAFIPTLNEAYGGGIAYFKPIDIPDLGVPVMIEEMDSWNQPANILSEKHVLGRRNKVVIPDVRGGREGTVSGHVIPLMGQTLEVLEAAFNTGATVLIQNHNPDVSGFKDMYVQIKDVNFERKTKMVSYGSLNNPDRRPLMAFTYSFEYVEVDRPSPIGVVIADNSWQVVLDTFADWEEVKNTRETWLDVLKRPFGPSGS